MDDKLATGAAFRCKKCAQPLENPNYPDHSGYELPPGKLPVVRILALANSDHYTSQETVYFMKERYSIQLMAAHSLLEQVMYEADPYFDPTVSTPAGGQGASGRRPEGPTVRRIKHVGRHFSVNTARPHDEPTGRDAVLWANRQRNNLQHTDHEWENSSPEVREQSVRELEVALKIILNAVEDLLPQIPLYVARAVRNDLSVFAARGPAVYADQIDYSGGDGTVVVRIRFATWGAWRPEGYIGVWYAVDNPVTADPTDSAHTGIDFNPLPLWHEMKLEIPLGRFTPIQSGAHQLRCQVRLFDGKPVRAPDRKHSWDLVYQSQEQTVSLIFKAYATIEQVVTTTGHIHGGQRGVLITVDFTVLGMAGQEGHLDVHLYREDRSLLADSDGEYRSPAGGVAIGAPFTPGFVDFRGRSDLFIPESQLHLVEGDHTLLWDAVILKHEPDGSWTRLAEKSGPFNVRIRAPQEAIPR